MNSGYGRAFFHDLGKTVPFIIHKDTEYGTVGAISHSLNCYANKEPSDIQIQFIRNSSPDGRTKNIIIISATKFAGI